jgi:pseudouridine synthase
MASRVVLAAGVQTLMKAEGTRHKAERLQKILSAAGVASRRASEQLITDGRVTVNGDVVRTLGTKADASADDIRVDGRRIRAAVHHRYILLNKPRGYVTTRSDPEGRKTVLDLLGDVGYVYPVGRLDYDTEGLLLLTSDGALAEQLTHPRHEVARVYEAIVVGVPDDAAMEKLRRGVFIEGGRTAPAEVHRGAVVKTAGGTTKLTITLREGRNRQVRKMCQAIGHPVRSLTRVQMGPLTLGRLRPGEWRELRVSEVAALQRSAPRAALRAEGGAARRGRSRRSRG